MILEQIKKPNDIKKLPEEVYPELAQEISLAGQSAPEQSVQDSSL